MTGGTGAREAWATKPVRVLLLELDGGSAHTVLAAASGFHVKTARSFAALLPALRDARPDVLVAALSEPSADDAVTLKELLRVAPGVAALVISEVVDDERVMGLIKAGAGGYLFRNDSAFLPTALRELLRGGAPMSPPISRLVMQRARRSSATMAAVTDASASKLLTPRQREILKLLQFGHSYEDIGVALDLSVNTVRSHVRVIYERLGAASKVEAVMVALELGILTRPRPSDSVRPPV
jgi:DNA-binding NarL/FixJ family response regulator